MNYLKLATQLSCMSRYSASLQWLWRRILREYSRGMYLGFWIFLYWTTLCWGRGQEQEYLSLIMKNSSTRKSRRTLGESFCTDISGNKIKHGNPFVPEGDNFCLHCKCLSGQAKECFTTDCAVPTCKKYKAVPGKCCAYTCPSGANSEAAELAIIISLSVGLLLLLVLLIFVIDRNRKKNQRNRMRNEVMEQSQNLRPRPLNNRLAAITEENNDGIEPPPPYTPGRGRYSFRKPQYASPPFTPNEPPPPYEIDSRDATDV